MAGFQVHVHPLYAQAAISIWRSSKPMLMTNLAGVMFTQPTTLGLFDRNAMEMCRIIHEAGGLVYGDGANA